MQANVWMDGIRSFFIMVDRGVYSTIGVLYDFITQMATNEMLETTSISGMANKLYSFLGIFMLFRVSFSLINYIINPDSISDKEKGGSKIIVNIIITFILIIITPFGFDLLRDAQNVIIDDAIIPRLILGNTSGDAPSANQFIISTECVNGNHNFPYIVAGSYYDENGEAVYNAGEYIAMMTIRPFFQIDKAAPSTQISDLFYGYGYCSAANIESLLNERIVNHSGRGTSIYTVNYTPLLSTVVGIILVFIFVGFALDVTLRSVRLAFLQVVAPIAIMSYIDPAASKRGLFTNWLRDVGVTWADLFIRLIAIYFAIFMIAEII